MRSKHLGKREYTGPLFTGWFSTPISAPQYLGEPSRLLAFNTRDHARAFCDVKNSEWCREQDTWHFFPVRVTETLKVQP